MNVTLWQRSEIATVVLIAFPLSWVKVGGKREQPRASHDTCVRERAGAMNEELGLTLVCFVSRGVGNTSMFGLWQYWERCQRMLSEKS